MRVLIQVGRWRILDLELFVREPDDPEYDDEPGGSVSLRGDIEPDFGFVYRNEVPATTLRPLEEDDEDSTHR